MPRYLRALRRRDNPREEALIAQLAELAQRSGGGASAANPLHAAGDDYSPLHGGIDDFGAALAGVTPRGRRTDDGEAGFFEQLARAAAAGAVRDTLELPQRVLATRAEERARGEQRDFAREMQGREAGQQTDLATLREGAESARQERALAATKAKPSEARQHIDEELARRSLERGDVEGYARGEPVTPEERAALLASVHEAQAAKSEQLRPRLIEQAQAEVGDIKGGEDNPAINRRFDRLSARVRRDLPAGGPEQEELLKALQAAFLEALDRRRKAGLRTSAEARRPYHRDPRKGIESEFTAPWLSFGSDENLRDFANQITWR